MQDPGSRSLLKELPRSLANAAIPSTKADPSTFPLAFSRSDGFNATPNRIALFSTLRGGRFICAAISSSDLADAASCIKRRSSAKRQRRFIVAAIYFDPFAFSPSSTRRRMFFERVTS
jgi:hypothetical protein